MDTTLIKLSTHSSTELCPPTTNPQQGRSGCSMSGTVSAWFKTVAPVLEDAVTPNSSKVVGRALVATESVGTSSLGNVYGRIVGSGVIPSLLRLGSS